MIKQAFFVNICENIFPANNHFLIKTNKRFLFKYLFIYCLDYDKFYVGQSIRHLGKRKEEHMGDISSSVCKHARSGHRINWDNIKI